MSNFSCSRCMAAARVSEFSSRYCSLRCCSKTHRKETSPANRNNLCLTKSVRSSSCKPILRNCSGSCSITATASDKEVLPFSVSKYAEKSSSKSVSWSASNVSPKRSTRRGAPLRSMWARRRLKKPARTVDVWWRWKNCGFSSDR